MPLYPAPRSGLPWRLRLGEKWDGWLQTHMTVLPEDTVGLLIQLSPIFQERPTQGPNPRAWYSANPESCFVPLGPEVDSRPKPMETQVAQVTPLTWGPESAGRQADV